MVVGQAKRCVISPILILLLTASLADTSAWANRVERQGYYTKSQAEAGQEIFSNTCAICHGDHLQGGAGPALAGKEFLSVSQFQQVTAEYFYHFMATHMPLTNPGSLTKAQYIDIMAYFLKENGYASGPHKLTANDQELKAIKIEPQN